MVTFTKRYETFTVGKVYCDGDCLSTDTKPTNGIANGSKLYEMDTGKRYMFDEENSTWIQVSTGEDGGSSGSGGAMLTMITYDTDHSTYVSDKAFEEIDAAFKSGVALYACENDLDSGGSYCRCDRVTFDAQGNTSGFNFTGFVNVSSNGVVVDFIEIYKDDTDGHTVVNVEQRSTDE